MRPLQSCVRPGLLLWLLLLLPAAAAHTPPALQRAVLEDLAGELSVETLAERDFVPVEGVLSRGYSGSTWWLRLQLPPLQGEHWLLRVRPTYLDHIEVYLPADDGWRRVDIGDRAALAHRGLPSQFPNLRLAPSPSPRTLYLRVQSTSTLMLHAELIDEADFRAGELGQLLLLTAHFAVMLLVLLWALLELAGRRDRVLLGWLPYQLLSMLAAPALLGYASLLWPHAPALADRSTSLIVLLLPATALLFHLLLLHSLGLPRWLLRGGALLATLTVPLLLLYASGAERLALAGNASLGALIALFMLLAAGLLQRSELLPLAVVRAVYLLHGLALVWQMAFLLGGIRGVEANLYGTQLQGVFSALLVAGLLLLRARGLRRSEREALRQLTQSRERAALERAQREASEAFLAMLAHELRTPLSVVSIALARADNSQRSVQLARAAVGDIADVVSRCLDVDRVEGGAVRVVPQRLALRTAVDDVLARCAGAARVDVALASDSVQADPQLLHTVLRNLLDNALKYSPADSRVTLRAMALEGGVAIEVDNAIGSAGLPDPERLFHKYYRSPAAQASTGAGLGTYLVKRLVEAHGGRVEWRPSAGHASIRVWLPH